MQSRLVTATFAALVVAGIALQLPRLQRASRDSARVSPSASAWPPGAPTRESFLAGLDSTHLDTVAEVLEPFRDRVRGQLFRPSRFSTHVAIEQSTGDGTTHNYALDARIEWSGQNGAVEIDLIRAPRDTMWFAARTEGAAISDLRWLERPGLLETGTSVDPRVPLMLGDMLVSDPVTLLDALRNDRAEAAGIDGTNLVLDVEMTSFGVPSGPDPVAATALVWLDAETRGVGIVRLFNAQGRLVRVYDDVLVEEGRLVSFAGASPFHGSRSVYLIDPESTPVR